MPRINPQLEEALSRYRDFFNKSFPLMQASGDKQSIINQIEQCISDNESAEKKWPDLYGACVGKYIWFFKVSYLHLHCYMII